MSGTGWHCPKHGRQTLTSNSSPPFCVMRTDNGYACGETLEHHTDGKHYPTDPAGANDALGTEAPAKPCSRRLNWRTADGTAAVTWCTLDDGHAGQCSGPPPRVIEVDDTGPGRMRR